MAIKTPERLVTPLGVDGNGAIYTFMSKVVLIVMPCILPEKSGA